MAAKNSPDSDNLRKRKRIIPTRPAGTPVNPAFSNPADELFAQGFANRNFNDLEATATISGTLLSENSNEPSLLNKPDSEASMVKSSKVKSSKVKITEDGNAQAGSSQVKYGKDVIRNIIETSPSHDFTKFTNSIVQNAIPEKYFRGQSKHTYDVLYQHTRGAINPVRRVQLTKLELMKLTGLSDKTVQTHIKHLKEVGLIMNHSLPGSHKGWMYEVFIPQEVEQPTITESSKVKSSKVKSGKNFTSQTGKNFTLLDHTNPIENKGVISVSKTSLKTNTKNDDDDARVNVAFSALTKRLDAAAEKLTGKGVSENETEKWGTLADLLILEMEAAARHTDTISSVPAFLTEVLRRKLLNGAAQFSIKSPRVRTDTVGKPNAAGEYEKKPLDAAGREAALLELQDFADEKFLADFEKWYTIEDWQWLTDRLGESDRSEK